MSGKTIICVEAYEQATFQPPGMDLDTFMALSQQGMYVQWQAPFVTVLYCTEEQLEFATKMLTAPIEEAEEIDTGLPTETTPVEIV